MNLNRINIEPRLRSAWEAIDLGFRLAKEWYRPLLLTWLIPMMVLASITALALQNYDWLALIIIWWFKPLFDRAPLFFISRALFGEKLGVGEVLKQLGSIYRFEWLASLSYRRFSFTRSYDLPITVLEGLSGQQRADRLRVLHRRNSGAAVWLSIVCICLEVFLVYGTLIFVELLIPEQTDYGVLTSDFMESTTGIWIEYGLWTIAMSLIAPFYVGAGFALYINRRIELEAWDVEIRFRQMAENTTPAEPPKRGLIIGLALALALTFCLWLPSPQSLAETAPEQESTPPVLEINSAEAAKNLIKEVMAEETFNRTAEVKHWRRKGSENQDETDSEEKSWWEEKLDAFFEWLLSQDDDKAGDKERKSELPDFALFFEIMLWGMAALLIGWLLYKYRQNIRHLVQKLGAPNEGKPSEKAQILFGLEVTQESLPNDIPTRVAELCQQQQYRQALSLLYRASLANLMHDHGFRFYDSHTEGECVNIVKAGGNVSLSQYTEELTISWQRLAYGHQVPAQIHIEHLCGRWQEVFVREE
ncbi:hypothetical protein [Halioxenophilus sp. WMMB6]|uniref:hypothetical protein n=1 Tax=Halioxenophilus sp. WMMB6 TaxID=3073815 RepID=UPI00295EDCC0|nr:hypothetical protein [Halioxenophilus sp. WMMB6]